MIANSDHIISFQVCFFALQPARDENTRKGHSPRSLPALKRYFLSGLQQYDARYPA